MGKANQQLVMKYRNKLKELYVIIIRIIAASFILLFIAIFNVNPIASILLIVVFAAIALFSAYTHLEIQDDQIVIQRKRLVKFLSSRIKVDMRNIKSFSYSPQVVKPLIILLPGHGGLEPARIEIVTKEECKHTLFLRLTKKEQIEIKRMIKKPSP
jgi:hypothetical protein